MFTSKKGGRSSFVFERPRLVLWASIIVALIMRFYYAINIPFLLDEANVVIESRRSFSDLFFLRYWDTAHPPLFNIFIKLIKQISTHPTFLRLPGVILGSFSLFYLYKIAKFLTKSSAVGVVAALLGSVSFFLARYSALARPYGMQHFFVLGFIYWWLRINLEKHWVKKSIVFLLTFSILATLTDYSFLWVLLAITASELIWIAIEILRKRLDSKLLGKRTKILLLCYIPFLVWLPVFWVGLNKGLDLEGYLGDSLARYFVLDLGLIFRSFTLFGSFNRYFNGVLVLLVALFFISELAKSNRWESRSSIFLFSLGIIPLVAAIVFSYLVTPIVLPKNLFPSVYTFLIFIAIAIVEISKRDFRLGVIGFLFVAVYQIILLNINLNTAADSDIVFAKEVREVRKNLYDKKYFGRSTIVLDEATAGRFNLLNYYFGRYDQAVPTKSDNPVVLLESSVRNNTSFIFLTRDESYPTDYLELPSKYIEVKKSKCRFHYLMSSGSINAFICGGSIRMQKSAK